MSNEKTQYVYALWDTNEDNIRYIGITTNMQRRFNSHLNRAVKTIHAEYRTHKSTWIRKCLRDKIKIGYTVLCTCKTLTQANQKEMEFISNYRQRGFDLTNTTLGGDGTKGVKMSDEQKQIVSRTHKGKPRSPEVRAKISESHKGRKKSPEHNEAIRLANIGRVTSPKTKEKLREINAGKKMSPESVELTRQANTGKPKSQETRQK